MKFERKINFVTQSYIMDYSQKLLNVKTCR